MRYMVAQFFFIKPRRAEPDEIPALDKNLCLSNNEKGIETVVFLDLNILAEMSRVVNNKLSLQSSYLSEVASFFHNLPHIVLAPGFALLEASNEYKKSMNVDFNLFLQRYLPQFIDAPNISNEFFENEDSRSFNNLIEIEKRLCAITYVSLLKIHFIARNFKDAKPIEKFERFIRYMDGKANIVGAFEAEIAKYCFFDHSVIKDRREQDECVSIVKNYMKKSKSKEELLANCLNATRDLMLYRAVALQDKVMLDGTLQDTWLLTADKGIKTLSEAIYYTENPDQKNMPVVSKARDAKRYLAYDYWNEADEIQGSILSLRASRRKESKENAPLDKIEVFNNILNCIAELESRF